MNYRIFFTNNLSNKTQAILVKPITSHTTTNTKQQITQLGLRITAVCNTTDKGNESVKQPPAPIPNKSALTKLAKTKAENNLQSSSREGTSLQKREPLIKKQQIKQQFPNVTGEAAFPTLTLLAVDKVIHSKGRRWRYIISCLRLLLLRQTGMNLDIVALV